MSMLEEEWHRHDTYFIWGQFIISLRNASLSRLRCFRVNLTIGRAVILEGALFFSLSRSMKRKPVLSTSITYEEYFSFGILMAMTCWRVAKFNYELRKIYIYNIYNIAHQRAIVRNQGSSCASASWEYAEGMMTLLPEASGPRSLRSRRRFPSWLCSPATRHSVCPKNCNETSLMIKKFLW